MTLREQLNEIKNANAEDLIKIYNRLSHLEEVEKCRFASEQWTAYVACVEELRGRLEYSNGRKAEY